MEWKGKVMIEDLEKSVINGKFYEVDEKLKKMSKDEQKELIFKIGIKTESLLVYTYIWHRIITEKDYKEIIDWHETALSVLIHCINFLEGAYSSALYHARKITELEPDNIENFVQLLFFYDIPERLLDEKEAKKIAEKIIEVNPNNQVAARVLEGKE